MRTLADAVNESIRRDAQAREEWLRAELAERGLTVEEAIHDWHIEAEPAYVSSGLDDVGDHVISVRQMMRLVRNPPFLDAGAFI